MLTLTFEEIFIRFCIDNKPMSNIKIGDVGKVIILTPIEIVMRDQTPDNSNENNFNLILFLHPSDGTHWILAIRRDDENIHYFDSFGVKTPPVFLKEYVDLGSDERIQEYDESYCWTYSLYVIYLIDNGYRKKSALITLVNQVKSPEAYDEYLGCKVKGKFGVEVGVNVNANQKACFADDNVNDNINERVNDNVNDNISDIDNDNGNENVTDNVSGFNPQTKVMLMTMLMSRLMVNKSPPCQMMMTQCGRRLVKGTKCLVGVTGLAIPQPNKEINPVHNVVVDVDVEGPPVLVPQGRALFSNGLRGPFPKGIKAWYTSK